MGFVEAKVAAAITLDVITAVGGIIIGLLILYLPDKDLKEIQKL